MNSPFSVVSLLFVIVAVPIVGAASNMDEAKAKFEVGVSMFQKENYPAALKAFEDSYALNPKTSVLYNIGMCQKALFRYVNSIAAFAKYLKEGEGQIPKDKRTKAEAALKEMNSLVGTLALEKAPVGAEVLLDGEKVGTTPLVVPISVDPGDHSVHVLKAGFDSFESKISVESGAALSVQVKLEPLVAKLIIDCRAEDAVIKVDGQVVGGCPMVGDVSAGIHEITVSSPTSQQYTKTVEVGPGGETTVSVVLVPEAGKNTAPATASKTVTSTVTSLSSSQLGTANAPQTSKPKSRKARTKLVLGITSLAVGAGMGIVGGVFTAQSSNDVDKGDARWNQMMSAGTTEERNAALLEYNDIRNDDLPRHKTLMIVGYATGGVFLTLGVILTVLGASDEDKQEHPLSLKPNGLAVRF